MNAARSTETSNTERSGASLMRCVHRDGGRSSVVALQEEVTNHPQVAAVKSRRW